MDLVSLFHVAATLGMTGIIWFVQLVHYPSFALIERSRFAAFERRHARMTTLVVGPLMLVEFVTAAALLVAAPDGIDAWMPRAGALVLVVIWWSTWLVQVPCHARLERGFDAAAHRRLVRSNCIRTAGWSGRAALALAMAASAGS